MMIGRGLVIAFAAAVWTVCPAAAMLVSTGTSAPERTAAEELRVFIGALAENEPDLRFRLGVAAADAFPDDKAWIGDTDGFAVRRRDGEIFIFANRPCGVLYGVYAFLERNSDIVWARPDPACGTVFTRTKDFVVHDADFRDRPVFGLRGWWFCSSSDFDAARWCARMRCNLEPIPTGPSLRLRKTQKANLEISRKYGFLNSPGGGHNLHLFMPPEMFETHPEYFCEIDGCRIREVSKAQLCFSAPGCARVAGETAVRRIADLGYEPDVFQIKTQDNLRWCECAKCREPIRLPDGRIVKPEDANFRSTQFFIWLNAVMDEIRKTYTHVRVQTLVYENTVEVPAVLPREGIVGAFCPYVKNDKYSILDDPKRKWLPKIEAWAASGFREIAWREYYGCARAFPRPLADVAAKDLRHLSERLHFTGAFSETGVDRGEGRWDVCAMEHWVLSRLMWNPQCDVNALRADYLRRAYRRAARPMGEFYAAIRRSWYASDFKSIWSDGAPTMAYRYIHEAGITDTCRDALSRAGAAAEGELPAVKENVRRARDAFEGWMARVKDFGRPETDVPRTGDWSKAASIDAFRRRGDPGRMPWPREKTRVDVRHDGKTLYIRAVCGDSHMATVTAAPFGQADDRRFRGDQFRLTLADGNPETDATKVYRFSVDVNGNRQDARVRPSNWRWDAEWTASVVRNEKDFTVEMALPFASFDFDPNEKKDLYVVPMRVYRHDRTDGATAFFSWLGMDDLKYERFGVWHLK